VDDDWVIVSSVSLDDKSQPELNHANIVEPLGKAIEENANGINDVSSNLQLNLSDDMY
jgi:hypothetical protein